MEHILKENFKTYEFERFEEDSTRQSDVDNYEFQTLAEFHEKNGEREFDIKDSDGEAFRVSPIVKTHKKINHYFEIYKEKKIKDEVERRLLKLGEEGFNKGFNEGIKQGEEKTYRERKKFLKKEMDDFSKLVEDTLKTKKTILEREKHSVYELIKSLAKWVILRELKDDDRYLLRLLEKLMSEIENKNNVLIQINRENFEKNKDIFQEMQSVLKETSNVKFDINGDIDTQGIILTTENEVIDGTLEEQFKGLDKIFSQIGLRKNETHNIDEKEDVSEGSNE